MSYKNLFTITSNKMTRFSLSLLNSVELVDWALKNCIGGEIVVPKIPSYRILDLAKAINPKAKIKIIGIRPGEKIYEELISNHDSFNTFRVNNYYIILPQGNQKLIKYYKKKFKISKVKENFSFRSDLNEKFLSTKDLKKIVKNL